MIVLRLEPEVETRAIAQARAAGLPLERYLTSLIEQATRVASTAPVTAEEQERLLDELAEGLSERLKDLPASTSVAYNRADIYLEHD